VYRDFLHQVFFPRIFFPEASPLSMTPAQISTCINGTGGKLAGGK
jgi:hypothetical protein